MSAASSSRRQLSVSTSACLPPSMARSCSSSTAPSPPFSTPSDLGDASHGYPDRDRFYQKVEQYIQTRKIKAVLTASEISDIARLIANPEELRSHADPSYRKWIQKHFVLRKAPLGGSVVAHRTKGQVVAKEHLYDTLYTAHAKEPHGGRDKTTREIHNENRWILKGLVELFVKSCPTCHLRNEASTRSRAATIAANGDLNCSSASRAVSHHGVGPTRTGRSYSITSAVSPYPRYRTMSEMAPSASSLYMGRAPEQGKHVSSRQAPLDTTKHRRTRSAMPTAYFTDLTGAMPSVLFDCAVNEAESSNTLSTAASVTNQGYVGAMSKYTGSRAMAAPPMEAEGPAGLTYQNSSVYQAPHSLSHGRNLQSPHGLAFSTGQQATSSSNTSYLSGQHPCTESALTTHTPFTESALSQAPLTESTVTQTHFTDTLNPVTGAEACHDFTDLQAPHPPPSFDNHSTQDFTVPFLCDKDDFYRFYSVYSAFEQPSRSNQVPVLNDPLACTPSAASVSTWTTSQPNSAASIILPPPFGQAGFEGLFGSEFTLGSSSHSTRDPDSHVAEYESDYNVPITMITQPSNDSAVGASVGQWEDLLGYVPNSLAQPQPQPSYHIMQEGRRLGVAPSRGPWSDVVVDVARASSTSTDAHTTSKVHGVPCIPALDTVGLSIAHPFTDGDGFDDDATRL